MSVRSLRRSVPPSLRRVVDGWRRVVPEGVNPGLDIGRVIEGAGYNASPVPETLVLGSRLRSVHLIARGVSGVGKTAMLVPMVLQDIITGQPLLAIDPVGTCVPVVVELLGALNRQMAMGERTGFAALDTARREAREALFGNIIVVDFSEDDLNGWRWNPLELADGFTSHETADCFIASLERVVGDMVEMRRLQTILKATLTCLIELGSLGTPVSLPDLLDFLIADTLSIEHFIGLLQRKRARGEFRHDVRPTMIEAYLGHFFAQTSHKERRELVQSTWNCISLVLSDPKLDRFFCGSSRSNLSFSQIVNEGRTLLVNLPSGLGMNTKAVASAAIINRIETVCQKRRDADVKAGRVPPFTIYCDEFQECFTSQWMTSIATCRNKGLRVVVAHQAATQFVGEEGQQMLRAFMANCATQVYFRCSWDDAKEVAGPIFKPTGMMVKRRETQVTETQSRTHTVSQTIAAQISESESAMRGSTWSMAVGESHGFSVSEANGISRVESDSVSVTRGRGWSRATSKGSGSSVTVSEGEAVSEASGAAQGSSHSEGTSSSSGQTTATFDSQGTSVDLHAIGLMGAKSSTGSGISRGDSASSGSSIADAISSVFSSVRGLSRSKSRAVGHSRSKSVTRGESGNESEGHAHAIARGLSVVHGLVESVSSSVSRSLGEQRSVGTSHGRSWSMADGQSEARGISRSVSETTQYYSVQEEIIQHANELSMLPPRTAWVVVNDAQTAAYKIVTHDMPLRVETVWGGVDYLDDFRRLTAAPKVPEASSLALVTRIMKGTRR